MFNPCFCISLQKGVRILAIVSLLSTLILIAEEISLIAIKGCKGIQAIQNQNPEFSVADEDSIRYDVPESPKVLQTNASSFDFRPSVNLTHNPSNVSKSKIDTTTRKSTILVLDFDSTTSVCHMQLSELLLSGVWILSWVFDLGLAVLLVIGCEKKSIRMCSIWFYVRCAILVFRICFLIMYLIQGFAILWKIPVMILFVFRIYSLWVVNYYIKEMSVEREARQKPRVSVTSTKTDLEKYEVEKTFGTPLW